MSKQTIAWWVAAAVAAIFLLGLGSLGSYSSLGGEAAVSLMAGIVLFFVGAIVSTVALYWMYRK